MVSHNCVDNYNVNGATEFALKKLITGIPYTPDMVLMDGNFKFKVDFPFQSVIKGDQLSISIASASIIAKVNRDIILDKLDQIYNGYGFSKNKGYGTKAHRDAIDKLGHSQVHRKTYEPVKSMLMDEGPNYENQSS
jgi:ribonuclease HII